MRDQPICNNYQHSASKSSHMPAIILLTSKRFSLISSPAIAGQLYNLLVANPAYKTTVGSIQVPGDTARNLVVITGNSQTPSLTLLGPAPCTEPVTLRVVLRPNFPQQPPYVTIEAQPGRQIGLVDYLKGAEVTIPYLANWNPTAYPPPDLVLTLR